MFTITLVSSLIVAGLFKFIVVFSRPLAWDYVVVLCLRRPRRDGRRGYRRLIMGMRATVIEDARHGIIRRVEVILPQLDEESLDLLANSPDVVQKKPWTRRDGRYSIDLRHLHRKRPASRTIEAWAEALPGGGARFVAERPPRVF